MAAYSYEQRQVCCGLARLTSDSPRAMLDELLREAAFEHNAPALRLLVRLGARVDSVDAKGRSALHWACANPPADGDALAVGVLRRRGASTSLTDLKGFSATDLARASGYAAALPHLLHAPVPLRPRPAPVVQRPAPVPGFWRRLAGALTLDLEVHAQTAQTA